MWRRQLHHPDQSGILWHQAAQSHHRLHPTGSVVVSWPATGSYLLQQNSRLVMTNWTTTGYPITTANGTNSITVTPPKGNLFFRLSNP
ncbi:MAG: hypothetical protein WDN00_18020 [Limisphaerales bacterium]